MAFGLPKPSANVWSFPDNQRSRNDLPLADEITPPSHPLLSCKNQGGNSNGTAR
jgi:hypothetical protein